MTKDERQKLASERVPRVREGYNARIEALLKNLQFEISLALDYEEACQNNPYYKPSELDNAIVAKLQALKAKWQM